MASSLRRSTSSSTSSRWARLALPLTPTLTPTPTPTPTLPLTLTPDQVDEDTVGLLRDQFKALDADGSGELDANDLVLLTRACEMIGGPSKPKSQR